VTNPLLNRVQSYRALFQAKAATSRRWFFRAGAAFRIVFLRENGEPQPAAEVVLAHLSRFCRATRPTVMFDGQGRVDALASARMDGRREVFLLIMEHLHLDDRTLLRLQQHEDQGND